MKILLRKSLPIICLVLGLIMGNSAKIYFHRGTCGRLMCQSVGSTKEEVLKMQGKPTNVVNNVWFYNESSIIFYKNGGVKGWYNIDNNLNFRPCNEAEKNEFFRPLNNKIQ